MGVLLFVPAVTCRQYSYDRPTSAYLISRLTSYKLFWC